MEGRKKLYKKRESEQPSIYGGENIKYNKMETETDGLGLFTKIELFPSTE